MVINDNNRSLIFYVTRAYKRLFCMIFVNPFCRFDKIVHKYLIKTLLMYASNKSVIVSDCLFNHFACLQSIFFIDIDMII